MMRKVTFVDISRQSYGRTNEHLVSGAVETSRIVAVRVGKLSTVGDVVDLFTDDGRTFSVRGSVDDWVGDLEEQHDPD